MRLKPPATQIQQKSYREKNDLALALLRGNEDIKTYTDGICYDVVAFTRYLLGANITYADLQRNNGNDWLAKFDFTSGIQWTGTEAINLGTAVGFARRGKFFHAAVANGYNTVRSVNGFLLGDGWVASGDCNLSTLVPRPDLGAGTFMYPKDPNDQGAITIWLSRF